jgi:hypothetical protein
MATPSLPDPTPLRLYAGVSAHLAFLAQRPAAAACFVCRHAFEAEPVAPPGCERCGFEPLYHFHCYVDAIALEAVEAVFWASEDPSESEALARHAPFLCPGCRS